MKNVPIPLVLDLWALGHSARQVAEMVGLPNHKHVTRIVAHAREIRDRRAVLHFAGNGRLIGRPGRTAVPPVAIAVPALPQKTHCRKGHARTPDNVSAAGHCRACEHGRAVRRWQERAR